MQDNSIPDGETVIRSIIASILLAGNPGPDAAAIGMAVRTAGIIFRATRGTVYGERNPAQAVVEHQPG